MERSAGIITYRDDRFLIIKERRADYWGFPKGHLEGAETERQAAHRELYEETGLHATLLPGFEEAITYRNEGKGTEKTVTFFLGEAHEEEVTTNDEIADHEWLPYEEALERLTYDDLKELLQKAKTFLR